MFRISHGNGQVSDSFDDLKKCEQELKNQKEYSQRIHQPMGNLSIQKRDVETGDWFHLPK